MGGEGALSMLDGEGPDVGLIDQQTGEVQCPEEEFEESEVHVVVVAIIDQAPVRVLHQHKPHPGVVTGVDVKKSELSHLNRIATTDM